MDWEGTAKARSTRKLAFIEAIGMAVPNYCLPFVTRVFAVTNDETPIEHRGTALIASHAGRVVFVTASHVLAAIKEEPRYVSAGISALRRDTTFDTYDLPELDVAVIIPGRDVTLAEAKHAFPLDRSETKPGALEDDYLMALGFPIRFSRYSALLGGPVSTAYPHCTSVRPRVSDMAEGWEDLVDAATRRFVISDAELRDGQFALNFAEHTGPLKSPDGRDVTCLGTLDDYSGLYTDGVALPSQKPWGAFGLSGSPVWRFGAHECAWDATAWSTDRITLSGIVTNWHEGQEFLAATPIHQIVQRLGEHMGKS